MFAKRVTSDVGQRLQRPLSVELLEDRWVPSVSTAPAPVAVNFAGDHGEIFAAHQQTRASEESPVVQQSSLSPVGGTSATVTQSSSDDHAPAPSTGPGQTPTGSDDDGSRGATVGQPPSDDRAPAPSTGTGQTPTGSDDDGSRWATVNQPTSDDHAPVPSTGTGQIPAGSDDNGSRGTTVGQPSSDDHAPAPSASTGQTTPAGSEDDGHSGATVSRPPNQGNPPAPSAGTGQTTIAGSQDDRRASTSVSHSSGGEDSAQRNTHKGTDTTDNDSHTPVTAVMSASPGAGAEATGADAFATGTSRIGSMLPATGVSLSGSEGHPGMDPSLGVMRPASTTLVEGFVSEASLGSNAGKPDKSDAPEESPVPQVAGLIGEVVPFDLSNLEPYWQNFLGNLHECVDNLALLSTPARVAPWIVAAALTTTAFELARRRLKPPSEEFWLLEAADGRSSGLKHPAARPQP